ncbi:Uncharacterised protein [Mycobacterium tuberculosis]|uniref:Uncharacterized protein n=1 Tax=Mycobacterium tuberculosis TaxID=1773 RepID=A0A916LC27_MYCTX|nr:hypothetical protein BCGT_2659 [Mycobacterium tuberculosis variant bovis BCG str. ATCC 35743]AIB49520.1 hypothetical protein MTBK_29760 [Mycobacterium tuberculosis K]AKO25881.1 hypothetical protein GS11_2955 [Mycobacterium tuberculosis variant bovis BCG]AOZ44112.1 hypothetical protein BTB1458_3116 [Mycobacterium tuberculosis]BAL66877.1 hypothetical protein ERDMAN_3097 [Mycobacterium tuberculosis str. Erdman = ATCC 35801]
MTGLIQQDQWNCPGQNVSEMIGVPSEPCGAGVIRTSVRLAGSW